MGAPALGRAAFFFFEPAPPVVMSAGAAGCHTSQARGSSNGPRVEPCEGARACFPAGPTWWLPPPGRRTDDPVHEPARGAHPRAAQERHRRVRAARDEDRGGGRREPRVLPPPVHGAEEQRARRAPRHPPLLLLRLVGDLEEAEEHDVHGQRDGRLDEAREEAVPLAVLVREGGAGVSELVREREAVPWIVRTGAELVGQIGGQEAALRLDVPAAHGALLLAEPDLRTPGSGRGPPRQRARGFAALVNSASDDKGSERAKRKRSPRARLDRE